MFIGHFAVGFGAKKAAPRVSLGTLILAAEFVDFLFPLFVLLGLEALRVDPGNTKVVPFDFFRYPFTHSLATGIGWGLLLGLAYFALRRNGRGATVVGLAVVSHWVLDWITHRPDMPLWPGGPKVGLGLWNSVAGTVAVEGAMFVLGVALYLTVTRSRTFAIPTANAKRIGAAAKTLLRRTEAGRRKVRLLGVSASTLVPGTMRQLELFDDG